MRAWGLKNLCTLPLVQCQQPWTTSVPSFLVTHFVSMRSNVLKHEIFSALTGWRFVFWFRTIKFVIENMMAVLATCTFNRCTVSSFQMGHSSPLLMDSEWPLQPFHRLIQRIAFWSPWKWLSCSISLWKVTFYDTGVKELNYVWFWWMKTIMFWRLDGFSSGWVGLILR